jgi:hypothetical protein
MPQSPFQVPGPPECKAKRIPSLEILGPQLQPRRAAGHGVAVQPQLPIPVAEVDLPGRLGRARDHGSLEQGNGSREVLPPIQEDSEGVKRGGVRRFLIEDLFIELDGPVHIPGFLQLPGRPESLARTFQ